MAFTDYSGDSASATVLPNTFIVDDPMLGTSGETDDHWFRIPVTNATNRIILNIQSSNCALFMHLLDNSLTQLTVEYTSSWDYIVWDNLPVGDLYIRIRYSGGTVYDYEPSYKLNGTFIDGGVVTPLSYDPPTIEDTNGVNVTEDFIKHSTIDKSDDIKRHAPPVKPNWTREIHDLKTSNVQDRGAIGVKRGMVKLVGNKVGAIVDTNSTHYKLSGTVKKEGVVYANKTIRLYDRRTGEMIAETVSDNLGNWEFKTSLTQDDKFYVIAFDDMNAPVLQAVIHDNLIPVAQ